MLTQKMKPGSCDFTNKSRYSVHTHGITQSDFSNSKKAKIFFKNQPTSKLENLIFKDVKGRVFI